MAGSTMELERVHSRCVPRRKSSENVCMSIGYVANNQYVTELIDFRLSASRIDDFRTPIDTRRRRKCVSFRDPWFGIRDPGSGIQGSGMNGLGMHGLGIQDQGLVIRDSKCRHQ